VFYKQNNETKLQGNYDTGQEQQGVKITLKIGILLVICNVFIFDLIVGG
jgi:hypothetical protein